MMMPAGLRLLLIAGAIISCTYTLLKIRRSKMTPPDAVFWILLSFLFVLLGIFPGIAAFFAGLLGIQSTVNLVYLVILFLLLYRVFRQDQKLSRLEMQLQALVRRDAVREALKEEEHHEV